MQRQGAALSHGESWCSLAIMDYLMYHEALLSQSKNDLSIVNKRLHFETLQQEQSSKLPQQPPKHHSIALGNQNKDGLLQLFARNARFERIENNTQQFSFPRKTFQCGKWMGRLHECMDTSIESWFPLENTSNNARRQTKHILLSNSQYFLDWPNIIRTSAISHMHIPWDFFEPSESEPSHVATTEFYLLLWVLPKEFPKKKSSPPTWETAHQTYQVPSRRMQPSLSRATRHGPPPDNTTFFPYHFWTAVDCFTLLLLGTRMSLRWSCVQEEGSLEKTCGYGACKTNSLILLLSAPCLLWG